MKLNEQKFQWLVQNVDPTEFYSKIMTIPPEQQAAAGASNPQEGFAEMLGMQQPQQQQPQGAAPLPPGAMQQIMQSMQPGPAASAAPAAAPRMPQPISFPSVQIPRGAKGVPQLKDILGGPTGGSF